MEMDIKATINGSFSCTFNRSGLFPVTPSPYHPISAEMSRSPSHEIRIACTTTNQWPHFSGVVALEAEPVPHVARVHYASMLSPLQHCFSNRIVNFRIIQPFFASSHLFYCCIFPCMPTLFGLRGCYQLHLAFFPSSLRTSQCKTWTCEHPISNRSCTAN